MPVKEGQAMTPDQILTLLEHGGLAFVLFILLQRVMARLDNVTDQLIAILKQQRDIQAHLAKRSDAYFDNEDDVPR